MADLHQFVLDCGATFTNELYKLTQLSFVPFYNDVAETKRHAEEKITAACKKPEIKVPAVPAEPAPAPSVAAPSQAPPAGETPSAAAPEAPASAPAPPAAPEASVAPPTP